MISDAVGVLALSTNIEVIPMRGSVEKMLAAPHGTTFTITCSSKFGIDRTVQTAEEVAGLGYRVIPHIAARQVESEGALQEIVRRLGASGVTDLFVVGGDAAEPAGPFSGAADLLEALGDIEHSITRIGVGCYPEGHPAISGDVLDQDLRRKQRSADYMVSQLCFDAPALLGWLKERRSAGITLPLRVGVAGPVQIRKLIELSMRIGVGSSVRYLTKQHGIVRNLVRGSSYRPEELLAQLGDQAQHEALGIEGLHLFSFNQIELATGWLQGIAPLGGPTGPGRTGPPREGASAMTRAGERLSSPDLRVSAGSGPRHVAGLPVRNHCLVMAIVNVTPDSFSDGGLHLDAARAVERGLALAADGADVVDVGGESTRPGAGRVPAREELRRVLPVVRELAAHGVAVSIDTTRARVAEAALDAGALLVNDVSGGLGDPHMARCVATAKVPYVAMHWRAPSRDMHRYAEYGDVVADVCAELGRRLDALAGAGVDPERIILDPGLGFAKTPRHNWELLARLDELRAIGRPVLIGASRKSFLGRLLGDDDEVPPPEHRDSATAAVSALAALNGASCVRVHDVAGAIAAVRVAAAWGAAGRSPGQPDMSAHRPTPPRPYREPFRLDSAAIAPHAQIPR